MEKITYHQLNAGEILDQLNKIDHTTVMKYFKYFTPGQHEVLFYAYDNEKKCVAGFCSCIHTKRYSIQIMPDEIYVRNLTVFMDEKENKNYRNQGIGTKLLKEVEKYAKRNDYQRLVLESLNEYSDNFYFNRGWVYCGYDSEMIKEVNENIWISACILSECLGRCMSKKSKSRLGDEVLRMFGKKDYDKIFKYIEKTVDTNNETVNHYFKQKTIQKIENLILFNDCFPEIICEIQKMIDSGKYYTKLKECYENTGARMQLVNNSKTIRKSFINNVCADVYLLERNKHICKSRTETRAFFENKSTDTPAKV